MAEVITHQQADATATAVADADGDDDGNRVTRPDFVYVLESLSSSSSHVACSNGSLLPSPETDIKVLPAATLIASVLDSQRQGTVVWFYFENMLPGMTVTMQKTGAELALFGLSADDWPAGAPRTLLPETPPGWTIWRQSPQSLAVSRAQSSRRETAVIDGVLMPTHIATLMEELEEDQCLYTICVAGTAPAGDRIIMLPTKLLMPCVTIAAARGPEDVFGLGK